MVVIIGGGISGLTCAYQLRRLGRQVLLVEPSDRVGGVIRSIEQDGFLFDLGPQSFLSNDAILSLVEALGLESALLRGDPHAPRYVLLRGQLHRVPMAPPTLLTTPLLSRATKLRLLAEPLRTTRPPDQDESVAQFVRRKFGSDLLEHLVGPFVSGVYAGDPERLSVRSAFPSLHAWERTFGSVIRGALRSRPDKAARRPTLCNFRGGLATLTQALAGSLGDAIRKQTTVELVRRASGGNGAAFHVQVAGSGRLDKLSAAAVVIAAPADAAARFLGGLSTRLTQLLSQIEYSPVAVVSAGYRRGDVAHPLNGFGFLVPRKEKLHSLGTVWSSSLFPDRAPSGMVSLATFVGGATNPGVVERSKAELAALVEDEIAPVLRIRGPAVTRSVCTYARAIPQYNLGHPGFRDALRAEASACPGLFFAANYVEGPSVPACVDQAMRVAREVDDYLAASGSS